MMTKLIKDEKDFCFKILFHTSGEGQMRTTASNWFDDDDFSLGQKAGHQFFGWQWKKNPLSFIYVVAVKLLSDQMLKFKWTNQKI